MSLVPDDLLTVFDVGTHDGTPYLVCELLRGETLRERLAGGPPPREKALEVRFSGFRSRWTIHLSCAAATGRRAFAGGSTVETVGAILQEDPTHALARIAGDVWLLGLR